MKKVKKKLKVPRIKKEDFDDKNGTVTVRLHLPMTVYNVYYNKAKELGISTFRFMESILIKGDKL